jgi:uncharacterized protein (TIGR00730 family)
MARFAVTVYAGSRRSYPEAYGTLARELCRAVAARGWVLVYGGANIGLMGACADAALDAGGRVEGVILDTFARVLHQRVESMEIVSNMRERKASLAHRGDAFVVLPGAFGTLEELSEILVERQLAIHRKPLVVLDPDGYWSPLRAQFETMVRTGLLEPEYLGVLDVVPDVPAAMALIAAAAEVQAAGAGGQE